MLVISDMTTAQSQLQLPTPTLSPISVNKQQQESLDWFSYHSLDIPVLEPKFSRTMASYAFQPDYTMPQLIPDSTASSYSSMSSSSYLATNHWDYQGRSFEHAPIHRQAQSYTNPSISGCHWQLPVAINHPQNYQGQYTTPSDLNFQLASVQIPRPTPSPSMATKPSPSFQSITSFSPPLTPGSSCSLVNSPSVKSESIPSNSPNEYIKEGIYTHREQQQLFREALTLPMISFAGPFVPQLMYKPHTNSDRKRYVEEIKLDAPIFFWMNGPEECGIPLSDALHTRVKRLRDRDEPVFEGRGPSVSIRLEWPGYRQWSRQIPTKDFRSPPCPITRAKLAKGVAKCVERFIEDRKNIRMEDDADPRWRVGSDGSSAITLDDIILVSLYHVSLGSWQPQLRLRRPFNRSARA